MCKYILHGRILCIYGSGFIMSMDIRIDSDAVIGRATLLLKSYKRYIRQSDIKLYARIKAMNKVDIEFIEQFALIHLKNIEQNSHIPQNMYKVLDSYMFNNLFTLNFFTTIDMLRIILHRYKILPESMLLSHIKHKCATLLGDNLSKFRFQKHVKYALQLLFPMPCTQKDIESILLSCKDVVALERLDSIVINPLYLVFDTSISRDSLLECMQENLKELCKLCENKELMLDSTGEFFMEILESLRIIAPSISKKLRIAVSICSYELDSASKLDRLIQLAKELHEMYQIRLCARVKDLDINYERENLKATFLHRINSAFTNEQSIKANLLSLLLKCKENAHVIDCMLVSQDLFIIESSREIGLDLRIQISNMLNPPLLRTLKTHGFNVMSIQCYTKHFTYTIATRLREALHILNNGLISQLHCLNAKAEWGKLCNSFKHSVNIMGKEISDAILGNVNNAISEHSLESFSHELRRGFDIVTNSEELVSNLAQLETNMPNLDKLKDVLYLNSEDSNRIVFQSLSAPSIFSLYANKIKDSIGEAIKKQENIHVNRINIITGITTLLRERAPEAFCLLKHTNAYMPDSMLEEQVYMLIDSFKYYAYEHRKLLEDSSSVFIMPIGNVYIHAHNLAIHEIGSILASNIMIGNVTYISDHINAKILYYLLLPLLTEYPVIGICDLDSINHSIECEIIPKDLLHTKHYGRKLLISTKGTHVVFISSFYDFYEAFIEIQHARYLYKHIIIYADDYIYERAKEAFVSLHVYKSPLANIIKNMPSDISSFSLFTYNKAEMHYAIKHVKSSISINAFYKSKLISGSSRTFVAGYMQPFGSRLLLLNLLSASPNNVIKKNSLYSDIIGCFNDILSIDEIEFLYNLNHNYSQFLKKLSRGASLDNVYEIKKPYPLVLRIYKGDDFFYVCVIILIAFLLNLDSKISFNEDYVFDKEGMLDKILQALKEKYIDNFTFVIEKEGDFIDSLQTDTLVRILDEEENFMKSDTYIALTQKGIVAQYALPVLSKNIELEKYLFTQYIQIQPNVINI